MQADAQLSAQCVPSFVIQDVQLSVDRLQAFGGAQRVAVAHLPQRSAVACQGSPQIGQAIDLSFGALAVLRRKRYPIVPVDRCRSRGNRAGRPLRAVVLIARDTVLRGHLRADHLQQVELRRHLE